MKIKKDIITAIIAHAKKDAPIEACGYLASQNGGVVKHYELNNIDQSPEHFSFDQKDQFDVLRDTRAKGLKITGVYHSHPQSPARPSDEDIRLAYDPTYSYVIVSTAGESADVKSFQIKNSKVELQEIEVINDADL